MALPGLSLWAAGGALPWPVAPLLSRPRSRTEFHPRSSVSGSPGTGSDPEPAGVSPGTSSWRAVWAGFRDKPICVLENPPEAALVVASP